MKVIVSDGKTLAARWKLTGTFHKRDEFYILFLLKKNWEEESYIQKN